MKKFYLNSLILLAVILYLAAAEINYCNETMCPYQGKHVRCGNNGGFSENCTGDCRLEDITPYIPMILFDHNMYRNQLAGGNLQCFYPATRMPVLSWDKDLAENAKYNARSCVFEHDKCRSTPAYPYAGQNIYYARTSNLNVSISQFIGEAIFLWYEEYLDASYTLMQKYQRTIPQTGHLTTMMCDRQHKVGCALLSCLQTIDGKKWKRMIIFTCNYPSTNIKGLAVYKSGAVADDCVNKNDKFDALCDDKIDPNDIYWSEK